MSSNAHAFIVDDAHDVYTENKKLSNGTYCSLGPRLECNPKTTVAMMTVNSVICRSKYSNLFGGPKGNHIVACKNTEINYPLNVLWDYKYNELVKASDIVIHDENELVGNNYRFRCKSNGLDEMHNKYLEHPIERFYPVRNYCAHLIYSAHPDIKPKFYYDSFSCYCGNYFVTRVKT